MSIHTAQTSINQIFVNGGGNHVIRAYSGRSLILGKEDLLIPPPGNDPYKLGYILCSNEPVTDGQIFFYYRSGSTDMPNKRPLTDKNFVVESCNIDDKEFSYKLYESRIVVQDDKCKFILTLNGPKYVKLCYSGYWPSAVSKQEGLYIYGENIEVLDLSKIKIYSGNSLVLPESIKEIRLCQALYDSHKDCIPEGVKVYINE